MRGKTNYENLTLKFVTNLIKTFGHDITETFTKRELKLRSLIFTLRDKKIILPEKFYFELAKQLNVPYFDSEILKDINYLASALPYSVMRKNLVFLLQITDEKIVIATSNPFNFALFREMERIFKRKLELYIASTESIEYALDRGYREIHQMKAMDELKIKTPEYSASNVLYTWQKNFLFILLVTFILLFILEPYTVFFILFVIINVLYFIINPFKLIVALKGFETVRRKINITQQEVRQMDDSELPVYSVLIPVYKEAEIVPNIITNINKLDYPKDKLDVKILVEELDTDTIDALHKYGLLGEGTETIDGVPPELHKEMTKMFDVIVVPDAAIKTKPRACNYGLYRVSGDYTVIFDAEDEPEPDQLKKAILAFQKTGDEYACFQAHLNFYNPKENLLARWFSLEYSFWFDYWLQGLDISGAPLPLGGTSNHFQTATLKKLGAWDPYNVTEDADLGVRISQKKYKTGMLNSYTFEEANLKVGNWIRQRSRWIKGYVQTFFVHLRHPITLVKKLGLKQAFYFILNFGFNILFPLVNPLLWAVTLLTIFAPELTESLFTPEIKTICEFNLILGNLVYIILHIGPTIIKENYTSIPFAILLPLYWVLMSYAAWKGVLQLITRPFYWEKTQHGLTAYKPHANIEEILNKVRKNNLKIKYVDT
jgi:cellulose synthase/poly-beta-1,6-N-acetylglucosamine synthase-like glycosyltransferase